MAKRKGRKEKEKLFWFHLTKGWKGNVHLIKPWWDKPLQNWTEFHIYWVNICRYWTWYWKPREWTPLSSQSHSGRDGVQVGAVEPEVVDLWGWGAMGPPKLFSVSSHRHPPLIQWNCVRHLLCVWLCDITRDPKVNKTGKVPTFMEFSLIWETDIK